MSGREQILYHININKKIKNSSELFGLLTAIISGYYNWREGIYFHELRKMNYTLDQIGTLTGRSRSCMSIFSKNFSSQIDLVDSESRQVPADKRATSCLRSLSTNEQIINKGDKNNPSQKN